MSGQKTESELWRSALDAGAVPAPVQLRIHNDACRLKDWSLLEKLAGYSELTDEVDALIGSNSRAAIVVAWMKRPGRSSEQLIERVKTEKRVTIQKVLASVEGLPVEVYEDLAGRAGFKALIALLGNRSAGTDVHDMAVKRIFEMVFTDKVGRVSYDDESSVWSAAQRTDELLEEIFEGQEHRVLYDFVDLFHRSAWSAVTTSVMVTAIEWFAEHTNEILHDEPETVERRYGTQQVRVRWAALDAISSACERKSFEPDEIDRVLAALRKAVGISDPRREFSKSSTYLYRAETREQFTQYLLDAIEHAEGMTSDVIASLGTAQADELAAAMVDLYNNATPSVQRRLTSIVLGNPNLTVDVIYSVVPQITQNGYSGYASAFTELDVVLTHLGGPQGPERIDHALEVLTHVEALAADGVYYNYVPSSAKMLRDMAYWVGSDNAPEFFDRVADELENNEGVALNSLVAIQYVNTQYGIDDLTESQTMRFADRISVSQLTNQSSGISELLWSLVFAAIPADNDMAWTKFMALLESEGPIGPVLRSVKRLVKASTPATSDTDGPEQMELKVA
ncbi:MAG: hypothetical protein GY871_01850 [Actinomycetales bacterium]|nr:hypothetical protein [Actinomycetales bacterium]